MSSKALHQLILLTMLTTLAVVGRIYFSIIPNVQPTTVIIILITLVFGMRSGVMVAIVSCLLSNIYLGMGLWTFGQMLAWSSVAILTGLWRPLYQRVPMVLTALLTGFMGFLFGFLMSLWTYVIDPMAFWAYYIRGIPFDIYHAVGNVAFYMLLAPILMPMLTEQKNRIMNKA